MSKKFHLLVIDDDDRIRELLSKYLRDNNYIISVARDTQEARELMSYFIFDLILVDLMMPGENGLSFTRFIKFNYNIPVLMLTALNDTENRIEGLESGAEDYLAKPFDPRELLIRIYKILERSFTKKNILSFGTLSYNLESKKLLKNNHYIELTEAENKFFHLLAINFSFTISRSELAELLQISERSVDVQITRLRYKIEEDPKKPYHLLTVRNLGYKLN